MIVEMYGFHLFLERLPLETDGQLLERKRFVISTLKYPISDDAVSERLRLSKFFHNVQFRGVTYASEIMEKIKH